LQIGDPTIESRKIRNKFVWFMYVGATTTTEGEKKEGGISEKKAPIDDLLIADVCFLQYICKRLHNKIRPL
jgi:hypothetical protein